VSGYRHVLRWAALPITDRRWAAPLSAVALGFGLFVGVAIGPGAADTVATGAARIVAIPGDAAGAVASTSEEAAEPRAPKTAKAGGSDDGVFSPESAASPSFEPLAPSEPEAAEPIETAEAPPREDEPAPAVEEPEADGKSLAGIVVHRNEAAGSYVVADREGSLAAVHASTAPRLGTKIEVPVRGLANGTYAERGQRRRSGTRTRASVAGTVTYVDANPAAPAYVVSARGVSMLVRVAPDPSGAPPELPLAGSLVTVAAEIGSVESSTEPPPTEVPPQTTTVVWQRKIEIEGTPLAYADFSGIVAEVRSESRELLVSADDAGESGAVLTFALPPEEVDASRLRVGDSILATATIGPEGTLALTGLAGDEHLRGADDEGTLQGDLAKSGSDEAG
jgi:hypothetical protein